MELRHNLGRYRVAAGARQVAPGQLNGHDTGELIRRAGLEAGLIPDAGLELRGPIGPIGRIDWAWFGEDGDAPRVAFAVEGCGVTSKKYRSRLDRARESLDRSGASMKIIVLFQVDHGAAAKPELAMAEKQAVVKYLGRPDIHVLLDQDLWEGIEQLARARMPKPA
jgi:hypothetical protein